MNPFKIEPLHRKSNSYSNLKYVTIGVTMLIVFLTGRNSYAQLTQLKNGTIIIDNFQNDKVGTLPYGWYNRDGTQKAWLLTGSQRAAYKWHIEQQGDNKFLHYQGTRAMHLNFPLEDQKKVNIYKTPILSWKWRVEKIPKGGDENVADKNDVGASIYVVFSINFLKMPKSIRYTWSSTLPVGTILSKYFNRQKIVVLASGKKNEGKWITFQRNIVQDYKNLFGGEPPKRPLAILILSDGNNTHSESIADYDDIELKPVDTSGK